MQPSRPLTGPEIRAYIARIVMLAAMIVLAYFACWRSAWARRDARVVVQAMDAPKPAPAPPAQPVPTPDAAAAAPATADTAGANAPLSDENHPTRHRRHRARRTTDDE